MDGEVNIVFNQQRENSISFFLILDIVLVVMLIALLFPESVWAAGRHVRSCSSVDWELGGNEHSNQENWRGVRGDNNVQNYSATGLYINSVDIWANSAYHAEWGWHIEGTTRDLNVWVRESGQLSTHIPERLVSEHANSRCGTTGTVTFTSTLMVCLCTTDKSVLSLACLVCFGRTITRATQDMPIGGTLRNAQPVVRVLFGVPTIPHGTPTQIGTSVG